MLHLLDDLGCQQYFENELIPVTMLGRPDIFATCVRGRLLCEIKFMSFLPTNRSLYTIQLLHCLKGTLGIADFAGVVVDSTGQQLKSYLRELPGKGSMLKLVSMGLQDGEPIPWTRRERWAKQIAEAVMQIHRKGFVVGALGTVDERCLLSSTIPIELFYATSKTNFGSATLGTAAYLRNSAKISARFLVLWGLDMWRIWQPSLLGLISSNFNTHHEHF
jgi:hypothetical protein